MHRLTLSLAAATWRASGTAAGEFAVLAATQDFKAFVESVQRDFPAVAAGFPSEAAKKDPDVGRDMVELVQAHGYVIERHYATTRDGYTLGMFRMPRAKEERSTSVLAGKPVAYLNHALLDSSWAYVWQGPGLSLGFILADAGFDVWFGNNRGNTYSTNHTTLSTDSTEFWDFSYDEMALLDLPAHVEYVLAATGAKTLSYVGHSQGTIQAFAGFSRNHTLADKVNLFIAMAPVAFIYNQESPLLKLALKLNADEVARLLGIRQFMTSAWHITALGAWLCGFIPSGCDRLIELVVGPGKHINNSKIDVFVSQTPAGTSVKNMMHWGQAIRKEAFRMYDYGVIGNLKHYRRTLPPDYDLAQLTVPTVLVTGDLDYLADPEDVKMLISKLPKNVLRQVINLPSYAHLDFTWAEDAYTTLYPQLVDLLRRAVQDPATSEVSVLV